MYSTYLFNFLCAITSGTTCLIDDCHGYYSVDVDEWMGGRMRK